MWEIITGERPQRGQLRLPHVPAECTQVGLCRGHCTAHTWGACRGQQLLQMVGVVKMHAAVSSSLHFPRKQVT